MIINPLTFETIIAMMGLAFLLILSALMSGSEIAFFSLTPQHLHSIKENQNKNGKIALSLLNQPDRLLATILIGNNFVNIGIVVLSTFITSTLIDFQNNELIVFLVQIVLVTFLILFFGEILPKVYANYYCKRFALFMALPLLILLKISYPLSSILMKSSWVINKKFKRKHNISIEDLSDAIDLTANEIKDEKIILQGIVKFANISVNEIMTSRMDVVAVDIHTPFNKLLETISESGYSRIPVYDESFDNIKGILFIKDLIMHLDEKSNFDWKKFIRPAYFVPETKKINDLLEEFQLKKIHIAIISDEYGRINGIVTLEDILEEIIGEINDEFDEEEVTFKKIDDKNFLFEGKTLINDFYKITQLPDDTFDEIRGEAETLAGLLLELRGEFPKKDEIIQFKGIKFRIEAIDQRRIKKIKITLKKIQDSNEKE